MSEVNVGRSGYQAKFIDDINSPMLQMTIFTFEDGVKEVVFGHEFANMRIGTAFLTRNREVIDYFESYFEHWFTLGTTAPLKVSIGASQVALPAP